MPKKKADEAKPAEGAYVGKADRKAAREAAQKAADAETARGDN